MSDHAVVKTPRRRRTTRVVSRDFNSLALGFASFEENVGRGGAISIPVECYKFVQGATTYRFTSADRPITLALLDVGTYAPTVVSRDALSFSQEDTALNLSVKMHRANAVAQLFIAYNPPTPVTLTIFRKHRSAPEEVILFVGKVVTCTFEGPEATLVCAPVSQAFRRRVPSLVFQSQCNWSLYGTGCGLNKNSFKDSGTVLQVAGSTIRATIFASHPDGWYENGWAETASGDRRFIIKHVGDTITLQSPFPSLSVGAAIDGFAGCDRTEATCISKFNNIVNHLGFPRIPTRNPYEGSLT